ncbi:hypothetical protein FRC07_012031 [Ceratobasidium sp. 392]|nr:hypothetical protein FRC07_012031 [Ceratobasidium sp. 392]
MGFDIHKAPVETLAREQVIQLAQKHTLRPQDATRRHLGVTILDLDVWVPYWKKKAGIKNTASLFADNKVGVTEEELLQHHFKFLTYGTVFGFKKENNVDTLVFAVQFLPLRTQDAKTQASERDVTGETYEARAQGSENGANVSKPLLDSEKENISFLGKWFYELKRIGKSVKTNRAHQHTGNRGFMIGQGWRAASDAGYSMGLYKTELTQDDIEAEKGKKMLWEEYQVKIRLVSEIFNHFFGRLVPAVRDGARRFMEEHQLPVLGTLKYGETDENSAPASSLYVSHSNFTNAPHKDNDINPYVFGIWLTTRTSDESVVDDPEEVSAHIKGGQFFFPDFGIAVDFNKCGGMVGITWRAKDDRHATAYTDTIPSTAEYMRWGSSIQVAKRTLNATRKVLAEGADVRDAEAYQTGRIGLGVKRKQEEEIRKQKSGKKPKSKNRPQDGSASAYM